MRAIVLEDSPYLLHGLWTVWSHRSLSLPTSLPTSLPRPPGGACLPPLETPIPVLHQPHANRRALPCSLHCCRQPAAAVRPVRPGRPAVLGPGGLHPAVQGEPRPATAISMANPCCSCKLTWCTGTRSAALALSSNTTSASALTTPSSRRGLGRRRACHSAAPPSVFGRCLSRGGEAVSAKMTELSRRRPGGLHVHRRDPLRRAYPLTRDWHSAAPPSPFSRRFQ